LREREAGVSHYNDQQSHGLGMDTGSSPETYADGRPTLFSVAFAVCLLVSFMSAFAHTWALKFGDDYTNVASNPLQQGVDNRDLKAAWKPLEIEKALYEDRGYGISVLNTQLWGKIREKLGTMSPAFELFILRLTGVFANFLEFVLITGFLVCAGRVRYCDKTAAFEPVSSTLYFRAVRLILFGVVLTWIWAAMPFGITVPYVGAIPILADLTGYQLGVVWASSPGLSFWVVGVVVWIGAYVAAANLRRLS
jgi:hypothetical protein